MNLLKIIGLSDEAFLLDSPLYIIKSMLAVATGYLVGKIIPIAHIDMISVLLGVMYNLEPINTTGIKNGISQIVASTLGAACTTVLIVLFGINGYTVAISMGLTLYVGLKLNWRMVSPVAIFTCIYMTQFVQADIMGNPSPWLTFRVRIVALIVGILIAIFYNYIFSFVYYKKIAFKRMEFAKKQVLIGLEYTQGQIQSRKENGRAYINVFPSIFNDLDIVYTNVELMKKETNHFFSTMEEEKLEIVLDIIKELRDMNHLAYDINHNLSRVGILADEYGEMWMDEINKTIYGLKRINFRMEKATKNRLRKSEGELKPDEKIENEFSGIDRIGQNLLEIRENAIRIKELAEIL